MAKHMNIPVFIPHLGCPNDCAFCNQRSITGKLSEVTAKEVQDIIETHLQYADGKKVEIAFFGGSFTGLPISKQEEYLSVAYPFVKSGKVTGIRLSTRPDYISDEILNLLKKYGVTTVELGAQSMCDDVLRLSKRGHSADDTRKAAKKIKEKGFSLGLQMMIGLPGDNMEKSLKTAREIVSLGAECTRIYPTVVLFNTKLYDMYKTGEYIPLSVEEAVETAKEAVKIFDAAGVNILRIGLQESETLGDGVAAGAYHPALGELVLSRIIRDGAEEYIIKNKPKELIIYADQRNMSAAVGQKKNNINYLKGKYNIPVFAEETEKAGIFAGEMPIGRQRKERK